MQVFHLYLFCVHFRTLLQCCQDTGNNFLLWAADVFYVSMCYADVLRFLLGHLDIATGIVIL